jgi:PleD family two-component response regulator
VPEPEGTVQKLIDRAGSELYKAKRQGRDRVSPAAPG